VLQHTTTTSNVANVELNLDIVLCRAIDLDAIIFVEDWMIAMEMGLVLE